MLAGLRRVPARVQLELLDADSQSSEFPAQRGADRVPYGQGYLGDGQALRYSKVKLDRECVVRDGDAEATRSLLDPAEDAIRPVPGEARDAVRPEGHPAHDALTARRVTSARPPIDWSGTRPPVCPSTAARERRGCVI